MKILKAIPSVGGILLLAVLAAATLSIFFKSPMYLSGYSSLLTSQYSSWLLLAGLLLGIAVYFAMRSGKLSRKWGRVYILLLMVFVLGQLFYLFSILNIANKNALPVSVIRSFKMESTAMKPQQTVGYGTYKNEVQQMDVYAPKNLEKSAIPVIYVHGGGFVAQSRKQTWASTNFYSELGYRVFSIDYPLAKKNLQTWNVAPRSVVSAMNFIRKNARKFHINPDKFILAGDSAGGAIVLQTDLGLREGSLVSFEGEAAPPPAAVVALYPGVSATDLWNDGRRGAILDETKVFEKYIGGSPQQFPSRYHDINLIKHLGSGMSPTLIVSGAQDHIVSIKPTEKFTAKARALGLPLTFVAMPYGEHVFDKNDNSVASQVKWGLIVSFLTKNKLLQK